MAEHETGGRQLSGCRCRHGQLRGDGDNSRRACGMHPPVQKPLLLASILFKFDGSPTTGSTYLEMLREAPHLLNKERRAPRTWARTS